MKKFEIGKSYEAYQTEYGSVTILRRTEKTVWVRNDGGIEWRMKIHHDANGNEYTVDSAVGAKWRDAFTYFA